ncbi:hypothetical protein ACTNB0_12780 [Lachnospiraceae bacterium HCP28S3_F9]
MKNKINNIELGLAEKSLKSIMEQYTKFSDSLSLSSSLNNAIKASYALPKMEIDRAIKASFVLPKMEVDRAIKALNMQAKIDISNIRKGVMTDAMASSLKEWNNTLRLFEKSYANESLKIISESMKTFSKSIRDSQVEQLCKIDYTKLFVDAMSQSDSLSQVAKKAYSMVQDDFTEETDLNESFTEEEIQEALREQVSNPDGFQTRVAKWTEKKKVQFFIIWNLLLFIWANFCQPYFQEKIGIPVTAYVVSNVKELPQKGANIICQLKQNIEAIVIEDTNYYYKVRFIDENGEEREGYVAKRNLKEIDEEEKEEPIEKEK